VSTPLVGELTSILYEQGRLVGELCGVRRVCEMGSQQGGAGIEPAYAESVHFGYRFRMRADTRFLNHTS
jgi:hypothetical protein